MNKKEKYINCYVCGKRIPRNLDSVEESAYSCGPVCELILKLGRASDINRRKIEDVVLKLKIEEQRKGLFPLLKNITFGFLVISLYEFLKYVITLVAT